MFWYFQRIGAGFSSYLLFDAVTMQAQQVAPPVLHCRDKFLIQGTIVPFGTSEEDITADVVGFAAICSLIFQVK